MKRRWRLVENWQRGGVGCEVGVWKGDFAAEVLTVVNPTRLVLVDPWRSRPEYKREWYAIPQDKMDQIHRSVEARFGNDPRVEIRRVASPEAAGLFPDETFDWVYVDGDHSFTGARDDLAAWWPKVKTGGLLCGDDYDRDHWWGDGVCRAVDDHASTHDRNLYTDREQWWIRK